MAEVQRMEIDDDYSDNGKFLFAWKSLKHDLDLIYDEDPCVDLAFLTKCYNKVYEYVMHVNKEQIDMRASGKQQFYPGRAQMVSRELYYCLIGFMNDKTDHFVTVIYDNVLKLALFSLLPSVAI